MTDIYNLNRKNNQLKSTLRQNQLKNGTYGFQYFKKEMLEVLNAYKTHKSIFKAASSVGVNPNMAMKWYGEGMAGNPSFRGFYLAVNDINGGHERDEVTFKKDLESVETVSENKNFEGDYKISRYGDGWSYTTYVDGEKIFIISNELETLKEKVISRHLPIE